MKKLQPTTQYKKDLKRFKNNPTKLEALKEILLKLQNDQPIPAEYLPHMLHGNYKGYT
jgi:mRNA interferase YafQ